MIRRSVLSYAVYFLPAVDRTEVKRLCSQHRVLSLSGVPRLAEVGGVSIAVGLKNGRPEILVNLNEAQAEGQELSSELLRLARVIQ